jgi:SAM-dependent methyltransferase
VKPDTSAHEYLFPCIKKIINGLALKRDDPVLDAGCGGGAFLNYLHRAGFKNSWGFDASSEGIETAKKNFPEISDKFFIHDCYDENLPIGNKFQLIISNHGYLKNLFIASLNRFDKHVDPLWEGGHIKFFSKDSLYKLFEEMKIKPIGFYGSGRLPLLWKSMVVVGKKSE